MQAPSRPRHQACSLMHASPHTSRNITTRSSRAQSHRIIIQTLHTPHTTYTPASHRHSPWTDRCCSVLFLSNADASAVAPSAPMPLPDACVATHITTHNHGPLAHNHIASSSSSTHAHAAHNTHSSITQTLTVDIQMLQRAVPLQRRCKRHRALVINAVP